MKKTLFLFLPLVAFADTCHLEQVGGGDWRIVCEGSGLVINYLDVTNDIYVIQDCETLKTSLLSTLDSTRSDFSVVKQSSVMLNAEINQGLIPTIQNSSFLNPSDRQTSLDFANSISSRSDTINVSVSNIEDALYNSPNSLENLIQSINCGSCPTNGASGGGSGGSGGACCDVDFTDIIDRLIAAEQQRAAISNQIARISHYLGEVTNQLAYSNFLQEHGWNDTTNYLQDVSFTLFGLSTNLFPEAYKTYTMPVGLGHYIKGNLTSGFTYGTLNTVASNPTTLGWLGAILREQFYSRGFLTSLNNYQYSLRELTFPILTNTISAIHRDQTNYFSFFRGEIGVRGVLEDWTSEQSDGTYHDFLTNHYLTVVRGGPLSGNQSSKTNWFSRIETLLAALVFTDSAETNTVDASAGNAERQQLSTSYETANQAAATFSEDFKTASQSIVTLYQNYFTTFENAAMPSHVVLMRLSNSDSSEEIEISFQSDSLGVLVEACRAITTFCWSSVGIFLLYKFLVWSARCVIVACQFIYRAISSVFKS